jgi:hypothetical protein
VGAPATRPRDAYQLRARSSSATSRSSSLHRSKILVVRSASSRVSGGSFSATSASSRRTSRICSVRFISAASSVAVRAGITVWKHRPARSVLSAGH